MTAISLDLSKKPELIWLSRLVADIQVVAQERDLLLVGAQARDLLLMHAYRIDTRRATEDVDLAFMVGDWSQFLDLRTRLVESGRFSELERTLHKLTHNGVGNSRVDLSRSRAWKTLSATSLGRQMTRQQ